MWAVRCVHEASLHADGLGSVFCTLTYRNRSDATGEQLKRGQFIPDSWSLDKADFQRFIKRLRKGNEERGSPPRPGLKYYHCGEYGNRCIHGLDLEKVGCPLCNVGRPHYHAIIFGVAFRDRVPYATQNGEVRYTSPELERIWGNGFVDVGEVTPQSAAYVARYCMKKVTGVQAEEHYRRVTEYGEVIELEPEYATMSNGLGAGWYERYRDDVYPSDEVPVPGASQPIDRKSPRYYDELLKRADPVMYEAVKQKRKQYKEDNPQEFEPQRLLSKYKVKKSQVSQLKRNL